MLDQRDTEKENKQCRHVEAITVVIAACVVVAAAVTAAWFVVDSTPPTGIEIINKLQMERKFFFWTRSLLVHGDEDAINILHVLAA